ncbi:MAG TPA: hypothetical protein VF081_07440 [Solirubrobacterales bacterium]
MNGPSLEAELRAANPVSREVVDAMALEEGEEEMLAAIAAEMEPQPRIEGSRRSGAGFRDWLGGLQLSRRPIALAGAAAVSAVFFVAFSTGGGPAGRPATAAAAERLAKVSPTVLIDAEGWRIESAGEAHGREGSMTFIRGDVPQSVLLERESLGAALGRAAELQWWNSSARQRIGELASAGYVRIGSAPVLGTRAQIYGGNPGSKYQEFVAIWDDGGRALALRGNYLEVGVIRKRLSLLREVAADRWAAELRGEVVKTKAGVSVQPPK